MHCVFGQNDYDYADDDEMKMVIINHDCFTNQPEL